MKRSKTPTNYIAVKASTKSDWDQCDFAIVNLTPEWLAAMQSRLENVKHFRGDVTFYSVVYWDAPDGYYVATNEELRKLFKDGSSWEYVTLEEGELENMEEPESRLDTDMMFVNAAGQIYFMCYGKHTGEEYSTDCIDMLTVLKHFKDNTAGK